MPDLWLFALASVILESLVSLTGVLIIPFSGQKLKTFTSFLVSLAVGAMLGDAFIHLLPDAFERTTSPTGTALCVLAGIFGFFVLEKFLHWRHGHQHENDEHKATVHPVGWMSLFASSLDNFVDGLVIGSSFLLSVPTGIATTVAIVLHEIPKEMGEFGVFIQAGFSKQRAILLNCLTALFSVTGTLLALWIGGSVGDFPALVTPFAAGIFIYIACSDLVPQLHQELKPSRSALQLVTMLVGVGLMLLVKFFE
jgi:zinc and cadmium transporter